MFFFDAADSNGFYGHFMDRFERYERMMKWSFIGLGVVCVVVGLLRWLGGYLN